MTIGAEKLTTHSKCVVRVVGQDERRAAGHAIGRETCVYYYRLF